MGKIQAKYKVKINSPENIRDLLQEAYQLADEQIKQCHTEITKLANSTQLQDEPMVARGVYSKAINDFLSMKDKAIAKKIEIAKLLTEIYKFNGDANKAINEGEVKNMSFDFSKIRSIINENEKNSSTNIKLDKMKT